MSSNIDWVDFAGVCVRVPLTIVEINENVIVEFLIPFNNGINENLFFKLKKKYSLWNFIYWIINGKIYFLFPPDFTMANQRGKTTRRTEQEISIFRQEHQSKIEINN